VGRTTERPGPTGWAYACGINQLQRPEIRRLAASAIFRRSERRIQHRSTWILLNNLPRVLARVAGIQQGHHLARNFAFDAHESDLFAADARNTERHWHHTIDLQVRSCDHISNTAVDSAQHLAKRPQKSSKGIEP